MKRKFKLYFVSLSTADLVLIATLFFGLAILLAHIIAPQSFDWAKDTISSLGGQHYTKSWIMQFGFVGYGLMIYTAIGSIKNKQQSDKFMMAYAVSVIFAGVFRAMPMDESLSYSGLENSFHAFFAAAGGVTIAAAMLFKFFESSEKDKFKHYWFLILTVSLMLLYGIAKRGHIALGRGLIQKILFATGSTWVLWSYSLRKTRSLN